MMTDTRDLILGGRTFAVPQLPLSVSRVVYPICRKLSLPGALVDRVMAEGLLAAMGDEDMADLADAAFGCAQLADPDLTRNAFDALPITPPELFDGFIGVIRYQTGMWVQAEPGAPDAPTGEATGVAAPQTSTSIESSPA